MTEKDWRERWESFGESFYKIFKEMSKWMEMQMLQNRLMKHEILDLKDRVNKVEAITGREVKRNEHDN